VALGLSLAVSLVLALAPVSAQAATLSGAWKAKIGSAGANGTATIQAYTTGTGTLALKIAKMKPATTLPVVLHKGTCGSVGAVLLTLPSIKTTRAGAASRTTSLTAAQIAKINAAAKAGKIAIRIGTGTARKCGLFAAQPIPAYVATTITMGKHPTDAAIAPSGVWVTNWLDLTVSRIDPATNSVLQTLKVGTATLAGDVLDVMAPSNIAFGEGSLWVALEGLHLDPSAVPEVQPKAGAILRLDPTTAAVQATIPIGTGPIDIVVSPGAVWVALINDKSVARIDTTTNQATGSIPVTSFPLGVAFGAGSLWVGGENGSVTRIDPATGQSTATIQTQDTGGAVAFGGNALWITNFGHDGASDGKVSRIDPATNQVVASVGIGSVGKSGTFDTIAVAGGSVWVGMNNAPTIVRVSATTNAILQRVTVAHDVYSITASDHTVWAVHRLTGDSASPQPNGVVSRVNY
jgi:hypothetical protein